MKQRGLTTVDGSFFVAYSRMDQAAVARLDKVLQGADPDALRGLKTAEFIARFAKLYAELDYVHPFADGNSRTLRTRRKFLVASRRSAKHWRKFASMYRHGWIKAKHRISGSWPRDANGASRRKAHARCNAAGAITRQTRGLSVKKQKSRQIEQSVGFCHHHH